MGIANLVPQGREQPAGGDDRRPAEPGVDHLLQPRGSCIEGGTRLRQIREQGGLAAQGLFQGGGPFHQKLPCLDEIRRAILDGLLGVCQSCGTVGQRRLQGLDIGQPPFEQYGSLAEGLPHVGEFGRTVLDRPLGLLQPCRAIDQCRLQDVGLGNMALEC